MDAPRDKAQPEWVPFDSSFSRPEFIKQLTDRGYTHYDANCREIIEEGMRDIRGSDTDIEDFFFGQSMPQCLPVQACIMWAIRFPFTRDPRVTQLPMHSKYTNHVPKWIPIDRSFGSSADRWLHMRGFDYYDAKLEWLLTQKLALNLDPTKLYSFFERMGPLIGMAGIYAAWNAPFPFSSGEYMVKCDHLPPVKFVKRKCQVLVDQLLAAGHTPEEVKNYFDKQAELPGIPPWTEESPLSCVPFWFNLEPNFTLPTFGLDTIFARQQFRKFNSFPSE